MGTHASQPLGIMDLGQDSAGSRRLTQDDQSGFKATTVVFTFELILGTDQKNY